MGPQILLILLKAKSFIKNHWKILLVIAAISVVLFAVWHKIKEKNDQIDTLNNSINALQHEMQNMNSQMGNMHRDFQNYSSEQRRINENYVSEMRTIHQDLSSKLDVLQQQAVGQRTQRARTYSQNPSEGTRNLSNLLGIPIEGQ